LQDACVGASFGDEPSSAAIPANAIRYPDPRVEGAGERFVVLAGEQGGDEQNALAEDADAWLAHRLAFGLPEAGAKGRGDFEYGDGFAHDIAMDQLNGIDFNKGCYVGQEVVSRMRHRGTARKRPMIVKALADLPPAPALVEADGVVVGEMGSARGKAGLAQIRTDRAAKALAAGKAFSVGGVAVTLLRPDWADYAEEFASGI